MLVSDYDDTFYLNDTDIEKNIKLVEKYQHELLFIIATGRSYYDYIKKRDKYNIKSKYVILNHGASIIKNDELIYNQEIDNNIKKELIKDLDIKELVDYFACAGKESRLSLDSDNLTKIHVKYINEEKTYNIYQKIKDKYGNFVNCFLVSNNTAIEIVSSLANKKDAILKLVNIENIVTSKIYTIGNGDTDYDMLKFFNGYAMKNSSNLIDKLITRKVKSVSDLIKIIVN